MITKKCLSCGKIYTPKSGFQKFCNTCRFEVKICPICTKKFKVYLRPSAKYCSFECYWKAVRLGIQQNNGFKKGHEYQNTGRTRFTSKKTINLWQNLTYQQKQKLARKKNKHKRSIAMKKVWQKPEFIKKWVKSNNIQPNKLEKQFEKYLNEILPGEYKFVGDFQFMLGSKCPDFLNVNGKKKLIELYGDYWHEGENPQNRIDYFKQYGFDCLVVWERELQNLDTVKNKVLKFNKLKNFI